MSLPLISIIIPVFNGVKYITEAVESVVSQDYSNIEIIIVDDGSTDDIKNTVAHIKDNRIRFFQIERAGVSAARNFAIEQSKGEWLAFLDADDIWLPGKLAQQAKLFDKSDLICGNGLYMGGPNNAKLLLPESKLLALREKGLCLMFTQNLIQMSSVCVRREALGGVRFDQKLTYGEDYALWLHLLNQPIRLKVILEPLFKYRIHESNSTSNATDEERKIAAILFEFSNSHLVEASYREQSKHAAVEFYYRYCKSQLRHMLLHPQTIFVLAAQSPNYGAETFKTFFLEISWLAEAIRNKAFKHRGSIEQL